MKFTIRQQPFPREASFYAHENRCYTSLKNLALTVGVGGSNEKKIKKYNLKKASSVFLFFFCADVIKFVRSTAISSRSEFFLANETEFLISVASSRCCLASSRVRLASSRKKKPARAGSYLS